MSAAATAAGGPAWAPADPAALRHALDAIGGAPALPGPSVRDYALDLARRVQESIVAWLGRALPWSGLPVVERIVVWSAVGAASLAVAALVVAIVRGWRGRRRVTADEAAPSDSVALPAAALRDATWWREELRRRLAAGAPRPALEAAWWWTARTIDPPGLDPSWTTGDLLRAAPRPALRAPLRRVDRLLWGGGAASAAAVHAVVGELGAAVGETSIGGGTVA